MGPTTAVMIERIDGGTSRGIGVRPVRDAAPARGGGVFAGELSRFAEAATTSSSSSKKTTEASAVEAVARPDGEQTKKVAGHPYARVLNGDDKGLYLNQLESSPRRGSVFRLVERDERTFHVYGTGADRVIVEVRKKDAATTTAGSQKATGGATAAG